MGKKEEVQRIIANIERLTKMINAVNEYNNKIMMTVVKEYVPAAEAFTNNFTSEPGMLFLQKSSTIATDTIETTKKIREYLIATGKCVENLAKAELKAQGINV
ncbi:hypothetical protein [Butyrivibrio sp. JL13D10]|uniref:hypothetical protein n=1 Tax=Butyrivibrio sp. JL13D10 TaxID=3236815 RepID=UPI0038B638B2